MTEKQCAWVEDSYSNWNTSCGEIFGFDELFRIDDFFANDDGVNLAVLDDGDCYPISFLEHATDAEIKAGKRLEVT